LVFMRRLLSLIAVVFVLAGACSGDSDDASTTTSTPTVSIPGGGDDTGTDASQESAEDAVTTTSGPLVSPEPDDVTASALLQPLGEGFEYIVYPRSEVDAVRRDILAGDSEALLFLRSFTVRGVQRDDGPVSVVLVYVVDPVAAQDQEFQTGVRRGFSSGLEETLIVIGTESLTRVQDESGLYRLLWFNDDFFMQFHGEDLTELNAAARTVMEQLAGPFPTTTTTTTTTTTAPPPVTTTTIAE
jgi:hypothetical protein